MGVFRPRKSARKRSLSTSRGSAPRVSKSPCWATLRRPKRRGSTKRSSRPDARVTMACVCFCRRFADDHSAGHAEVNNPLAARANRNRTLAAFCSRGLFAIAYQLEHDVFSHAAHFGDAGMFQGGRDLGGARLHGLGLRTQPNRLNGVSRNPLVQSAGDGFDFGKFRHKVQSTVESRLASARHAGRFGGSPKRRT